MPGIWLLRAAIFYLEQEIKSSLVSRYSLTETKSSKRHMSTHKPFQGIFWGGGRGRRSNLSVT